MVEHHPVHNSEVYLLGVPQRPSVPPPSPPSPLTPSAAEANSPIEELCLEDDILLDDEEGRSPLEKRRVSAAIHVLNTEATALRRLVHLYETDPVAISGFSAAIHAMTRHSGERGKIVVIGVGKSGHIAKKLVATFCVPALDTLPTIKAMTSTSDLELAASIRISSA